MDSSYLQMLWTYIPKTILMLGVLVTLIVLVLQRDAKAMGKARPLALGGLGVMLLVTLAVPLVYAAMNHAQLTGSLDSQMIHYGYAAVGAFFTILDALAVVLLGMGVLVAYPRSR